MVYYEKMVHAFLDRLGYANVTSPDSAAKLQREKKRQGSVENMAEKVFNYDIDYCFQDIPDENEFVVEDLQNQIKSGEATTLDMLTVDKY